MSDERPNPDALLAAIQKTDARQQRGKLKVFLGMAAGVGKTFSMLRAGQTAAKKGVDVVIGYVETHGRKETEALTAGLPLIPRRKMEYRGVVLEELDLDALLARKPHLALVDELPHTNIPGSRHAKRWQDVVELLDAGIDVYTTMNVQHAESRIDTIRQITGATVYETVPDSILDDADIELIDLPPEELIKRLEEGKVYLPERAEQAMMNFFREGNLNALREMALRLAADHVGQDVHDYLQAMQISGPWKSGHRLLVAVGPSPYSQQMIRWTRGLADNLDCPWLVVYVEQPRVLAGAAQEQLTRNLALARELRAEVITTSDSDITAAILRIARAQNVTQIILGKPDAESLFARLFGRSIVQRLISDSGNIEVHIVRPEENKARHKAPVWAYHSLSTPKEYVFSLVVAVGCTLLNAGLNEAFAASTQSMGFVYLFGVVCLALRVGRGPSLCAAAACALFWDYFFLPPKYTLYLTHLEDILMIGMYFIVALFLGRLISRIRLQEQAERRREERATALYLLMRDLAGATEIRELAERLGRQVSTAFKARAAIFLPDASGSLVVAGPESNALAVSEKEKAVAAWSYRFGKAAGRFTDNLPLSAALHLPLMTSRGALGVLAIEQGPSEPAMEQRDLLDAFARQAALVLEKIQLTQQAGQARLLAESEKLSKSLLNSISHELRTPIAAITTAASALNDARTAPTAASKENLVAEIQESAARLNRLIGNLLDMTRLESGKVKPRLDWCEVADLVNVALQHNQKELAGREVAVEIERPLPLVKMDFVLIEQALNNLLLNAAAYTPAGSPLRVKASINHNELSLGVLDHGPGLPQESLTHVFDKFFRAPGSPAGGTGLGLSIVKGFAEAHGGRVEARNLAEGGAQFTIFLPVEQAPEPALETVV